MSSMVIAKRYAKALMNLAVKENSVEQVGEGLDTLADALVESAEFAAALADPKVPQSVKAQIMAEVLKKAQAHTLVSNFVRLLTEKRRLVLMGEIRTAFHQLADEKAGRAYARVRVAEKLTGDQEARLKKQLENLSGKNLTLQVTVDPDLLGGAVARIGSTVWDGSLRNQLDQIRQSFIEG
ncbi:MAG: ATP synthase F1 subunit delta [Deltaproteobacteria bacterium]|nr:ATP synthase F1 subunit delta [Deltaproteobacteria bacterium]